MSPEKITGNGIDGKAADVFALGVMLFEMVCGYKPYLNEASASDPFYKEVLRDDFKKFWLKHGAASKIVVPSELKELVQGMLE